MDLFAHLLEQAGAICLRAMTMLDAVAIFDRLTIRVVVTDLLMPGGSGLELLVALRERRPSVPVVAATAQLVPSNDVLIARGFSAVVFKPIDPGELLAVVWHLARATRGPE